MSNAQIRNGLLCGVAAWALIQGAPAFAQAGPAAGADKDKAPSTSAIDEVVVTGIRASLASAASTKRNSSAIVDAISAEDIGKFPDQNLADSLQRVTGVQIQRANGEGTVISVRGLSPDFTRTQYNGRTITSTGARSFDFSSLASDFVSSIEVYKTPTADMIDGGLSATVNVRLARPLDIGKDRYVAAIEGLYERNARKFSPHVTGFVNKVFGDGTVGAYFGADYRERKYTTFSKTGFGTEVGVEARRLPPVDYNVDGDFNDTFRFEHTAGTIVTEGDSRRLTLVGGVQARPTDTLELWADVFYANLDEKQKAYAFAPRFTSIAGPNSGVRRSVVNGDTISFLDADGVWLVSIGQNNESSRVTVSPAAGATWTKDRLTLSTEANYSRTRREETALGMEGIGRASAYYDHRTDGDTFTDLGFTRGYDIFNPHNYNVVGLRGSYKAPTIDRNWSLRGDGRYDFNDGFVKKFSTGLNLSERKLDFRSARVLLSAQGLANLLGVPFNPTVEGGSFDGTPVMYRFSFPHAFSSYNGPVKPLTEGLVANMDTLLERVSLARILAAAPPTAAPASDFAVQERSIAAYARVDFGTEDDRLAGNIGLRYVKTEQTSIGSVPDFNTITFVQLAAQTLVDTAPAGKVDNNYENWLPSLNLRYAVNDNLLVRFGAARVMTRPTLSLLTTSTNISANVRSISSGNPRLKPFLADQVDLSLEYYFNTTGILSAAVFYKDIKNFVVNATKTETYPVRQGIGGPIATLDFSHFFPDNGAGAKLKGIELNAQVPLTFLPSPWDGFGVLANATLLDVGKVSAASGGPATPLPGVSKVSYNAAMYYEKSGFGARLSYTYRSKYTNNQLSFFGDGDFARSYGQFDASLSYEVNDHISINADASNILNEPSLTYNNQNLVRFYEDSGRRFTVGARARF